MSCIVGCHILVYDNVWVYGDVWVMMIDDVRRIYISMNDVLDMLDAVYGNITIMMIAWLLS